MANHDRAAQAGTSVKRKRAPSAEPSLPSSSYTIGWVCAINTESIAAQLFLDEVHRRPGVRATHDENDYILGAIGCHNIVIAVLPHGQYGLVSAASVAKDMVRSFPSIRIGLMVGIGGGAPSKDHDIRLGDVVVSAPGGGNGGVFQHDMGKTIQDEEMHATGFLNQPPAFIRAAVTGLRNQYRMDGHRLEEAIEERLRRKPRLRREFKQPSAATDRLYRSDFIHRPTAAESSCEACCGNELSNLVPPRRARTEEYDDNPAIHYGLIASGNQLMKDARIRDRLAAQKGVLCFEMEAAGLMNQFPFLVIRGICDYADTHKSDEWQGYASLTAAAYASDLISRVSLSEVAAEQRIIDVLKDIDKTMSEQRNISKRHLEIEEEREKRRFTEEESKCHCLFRLATSDEDATYEWYKDRVHVRVEGTCHWFLDQERFKDWLVKDSGILLVSADPGCGKSVLAKYLIDEGLKSRGLPQSTTICYFFFKDQDQNTVRQALCALLHQLLRERPVLVEHALKQFRIDGPNLIHSTTSLWKVWSNAVQDPRAGRVVVVLDALDECKEMEFSDLVRNLDQQFQHDRPLAQSRVKYLLISRPYDQIVSWFNSLLRKFPNIHVPGEESSGAIGQEVNCVIAHRVANMKDLSAPVKRSLEKALRMTEHRTYLWVYLVFDYLENEGFKRTVNGVRDAIKTLPKNVNEAYENILNKSKEHPIVRRALSIILAARRPLTITEMNYAVNMDMAVSSGYPDLEENSDFLRRLRSWCGLFVSVHLGKIYLLHQTAREFLLAEEVPSTTVSTALRWHRSILFRHAHEVLAQACVIYLNFFNSSMDERTDNLRSSREFIEYAASWWHDHFWRASPTEDDPLTSLALGILGAGSEAYAAWGQLFWVAEIWDQCYSNITPLSVASIFDLEAVVKLLLSKGVGVDSRDQQGRTPLTWAARVGRPAIVRLLLDAGAEVDSEDQDGRTPLSFAMSEDSHDVVELLLHKGADPHRRHKYGKTPLSYSPSQLHPGGGEREEVTDESRVLDKL